MQKHHISIDILTISEELERSGHLVEIGGPAFLASLINLVPTSLHATDYAHIVVEDALRRRLLEAANHVAKAAHRDDLTIEQALDEAEKAVFKVASYRSIHDITPVKVIVNRVYDHVSSVENLQGIPTGFTELDRILTGGQHKSDLIVVAGRPGSGKTGFLLSILRHASLEIGKHVALFSLEMDSDSMVMRLLSHISGIRLERIRSQCLGSDDWSVFIQASEQLGQSCFFIDDTPGLTLVQLRTRCRRLQMEFGLDLVAVDYLQLMSSGGRHENRTQEVSHISRSLKLIARELGVPILAAAQLSRGVDQRNDKRPVLADLRESGAIEQDSDIVLFLYRPEMYDDAAEKGTTKLTVAKHRNGPTGEIDLFFNISLNRFDNFKSQSQ
jgi:replicative DNA helicase